jgi:hypothetical protein
MRTLWASALVAGCTAAAPVSEPPVQVTPTRGATWPAARGEAELVMRAVGRDAAGAERELAGVPCRATTPYYAAEFETPARLLLPDFGPASPTVTVTCRAGAAEGHGEAPPRAVQGGGLYGWPAVGVSVGTGDWSGVGVGVSWYGGETGWTAGSPVVRYGPLRVVVE